MYMFFIKMNTYSLSCMHDASNYSAVHDASDYSAMYVVDSIVQLKPLLIAIVYLCMVPK